jgi:type III secretion protein U
MTREEVERDLRETEGDPAHRAQRRRLHRALSTQQMLEDVRTADMVLVAPEGVAVALRYAPAVAAAPIVVARGERLVARRIAEVAREAGVPVRVDERAAFIARSLAGPGQPQQTADEIPPWLFEPVAEILRVVRAGEP